MANTGGITASVVNVMNMQPIDGATAKLSGPADQSTTTAPDGSFKFSNLPPGDNYQIDLSANGFESERYVDIVVLENIVTDLQKLALRPAE